MDNHQNRRADPAKRRRPNRVEAIRLARRRERIEALAATLGLQHDQACTDTSRLFYLPRRPADGPPAETCIIEGVPCDIFALARAAGGAFDADLGSDTAGDGKARGGGSQAGDAMHKAVSRALREQGSAHQSWCYGPRGLAIALAGKFVDLVPLQRHIPLLVEVPPDGEPEGPFR